MYYMTNPLRQAISLAAVVGGILIGTVVYNQLDKHVFSKDEREKQS